MNQAQSFDVETVTVAGAPIDATERNGAVWVPLRRVCEALEIDPDSQRVKLAQKPWARTSVISVRDPAGRTQPTFVVELQSLPMWLATIDHTRVAESAVKRLIAFQTQAHDVLAAHFFGGSRTVTSTVRGSGSAAGSGGAPTTAMNAAVGSGSALQMLQMVPTAASMRRRLSRAWTPARAARSATRTASLARSRATQLASRAMSIWPATSTLYSATSVRTSATSLMDARSAPESASNITSAIRQHCSRRGISYRSVYSTVRADLGLRRTQDGGPALGRAKLRADQVLRLAATATRLGVPGVGAAVIAAILDGVDDPTRPGAIDAEVTSMARVAARSAERSAP